MFSTYLELREAASGLLVKTVLYCGILGIVWTKP